MIHHVQKTPYSSQSYLYIVAHPDRDEEGAEERDREREREILREEKLTQVNEKFVFKIHRPT